ncbi:MAG: putative rane associated protein [Gammaproteobacteria bacterium]|jgi:O-antigen/teichoic acid export membrane protein|nr:putative rane associated protein [Gammaproteobacteria bacterium]
MFQTNHFAEDLELVDAGFLNLGMATLGFIAQYLFNIFLARFLSPIDYGDFSIVTSTAAFWGVLLLLGHNQSSVRLFPPYLKDEKWDFAKTLLGYYRRYLVISCSITFFIGVTVYLFLHYYKNSIGQVHLVWHYLWLIPLISLMRFFSPFLCSIRRPGFSLATFKFYPCFFALVVSCFIYFVFYPFTLEKAVFAFTLATLLTILLQIFIVKISLPRALWLAKPLPSKPYVGLWFITSVQFLFINLFFQCQQPIILLVLKLAYKNSAVVGTLSAIFSLTEIMFLSSLGCSSVFGPLISLAKNNNDFGELQRLNNIGNLIMTGVSLILFFIFMVWGKTFLGHFGKAYTQGYTALLIVTAANGIRLATGMALYLLKFAGDTNFLAKITAITNIVLIGFGFALCYYYGLIGAAWTIFAVQCVFAIIYGVLIKVKLGIKPLGFI